MKLALLIIDCQNDFIKNASAYSCQMLNKGLIGNIGRLLKICRGKMDIIYTQHSIKKDKSNAEAFEPKNIRTCIIGTKGWKIIEDLKALKEDHVVRKDRYDAFQKTRLDDILKRKKIDSLIIAGVLTNNCVRATAEGAHYKGYKITIISDCCGATSYTKKITHEQIHKITLDDLQGRIYNTDILTLDQFFKHNKSFSF